MGISSIFSTDKVKFMFTLDKTEAVIGFIKTMIDKYQDKMKYQRLTQSLSMEDLTQQLKTSFKNKMDKKIFRSCNWEDVTVAIIDYVNEADDDV